jgi:hypothetical protein
LRSEIVSGNIAQGGQGGDTQREIAGGQGSGGAGGGLEENDGTATLIDVSLSANTARGGQGGQGGSMGGPGGDGIGGGLEIERGTITLQNDIITQNTSEGGAGGSGAHIGPGKGGGMAIRSAATAYLDAFTVANVIHNKASTSNKDFLGSYFLIS